MKNLYALLGIPAFLACLNVFPAFAEILEEVVRVESRPGILQKFILIQPAKLNAAVILFPGGHGALNLEMKSGKPHLQWGVNNFLVRTRNLFSRRALMVAVIDAPSDRQELNAVWRMGSEHAADIQAVIGALRKRANIPLWVVGTSMGTFSATNAAIRLGETFDGLVLTSSITRSPNKWSIHATHPNGIADMELEHITVPTLIVSHRDDKCRLTPSADAEKIKTRLTRARRVEIQYVTGGLPPQSDACQAMSAHGFLGVEKEVVHTIADFISNN